MKRNRKIQTTSASILFMVLSSITLLDCLLHCILGHNIVEMLLHQIIPVALGLEVPFDMQFLRFHPSPPGDELHEATHGDSLLHILKNKHTGVFFANGRTIYRRVEQTRICVEFSEIFGVDFGGRIFSEL